MMRRHGRAFRSGFLVNLTNPKVILFVLAFVPQFVDPWCRAGAAAISDFWRHYRCWWCCTVNGLLVGQFAGRARRLLFASPAVSRWLGRVTGTIFASLALRLALLERT